MELEKAFAEERAVWWTLEERGTRSANASPRGSLTGARALRRGDFASQRSVSGFYIFINIIISTYQNASIGQLSLIVCN